MQTTTTMATGAGQGGLASSCLAACLPCRPCAPSPERPTVQLLTTPWQKAQPAPQPATLTAAGFGTQARAAAPPAPTSRCGGAQPRLRLLLLLLPAMPHAALLSHQLYACQPACHAADGRLHQPHAHAHLPLFPSSPRPQVRDQEWIRGNAALRTAQQRGTPVRVCRAAARNGDPKQGFDYTCVGPEQWCCFEASAGWGWGCSTVAQPRLETRHGMAWLCSQAGQPWQAVHSCCSLLPHTDLPPAPSCLPWPGLQVRRTVLHHPRWHGAKPGGAPGLQVRPAAAPWLHRLGGGQSASFRCAAQSAGCVHRALTKAPVPSLFLLLCSPRFLLVGIPGHYRANKSVSWVSLQPGRRPRMPCAQRRPAGHAPALCCIGCVKLGDSLATAV